jgi:tetratricopeptide (TPR) repeat protein
MAGSLVLDNGRILTGVKAEEKPNGWLVSFKTGKVLLAKDLVHGWSDEKVEIAFGEFKGKYVTVAGKSLPHLRKKRAEKLDSLFASVASEWGLDPAKQPRFTVPLESPTQLVAVTALIRVLPGASGDAFPQAALADFYAADRGVDGLHFERLKTGAGHDLKLEKLFGKGVATAWRPEGWSLVHYFAADAKRWKEFQAAAKKGEGLRKWLEGRKGLLAAWKKHVDGLTLTTAKQCVDAARLALADGRTRRAGALLEKAVAVGTKDPAAFDNLAEIYVLEKQPALALKTWEAALKADPLNVRARRSIGLHLTDRGVGRVGGLHLKLADDIEKALAAGK